MWVSLAEKVFKVMESKVTQRSDDHKICVNSTAAEPLNRFEPKLITNRHRHRVDHGGGASHPKNLERGDCPRDFVMLQNFKHQITCITM